MPLRSLAALPGREWLPWSLVWSRHLWKLLIAVLSVTLVVNAAESAVAVLGSASSAASFG